MFQQYMELELKTIQVQYTTFTNYTSNCCILCQKYLLMYLFGKFSPSARTFMPNSKAAAPSSASAVPPCHQHSSSAVTVGSTLRPRRKRLWPRPLPWRMRSFKIAAEAACAAHKGVQGRVRVTSTADKGKAEAISTADEGKAEAEAASTADKRSWPRRRLRRTRSRPTRVHDVRDCG